MRYAVRRRADIALAWILSAACLVCCAPAEAASFTVDSEIDAVDANIGDGICATGGGVCTLRAAIQESNDSAGLPIESFYCRAFFVDQRYDHFTIVGCHP